ncbi:AAA domain-containing protein [Streptomyces sp. NPDC049954]|uniref:DEAD/DEAH box helicase n=1 Tax=Streptomyces sp. NPDC049954 TaxID=3155779 RepID=UPI00343B3C2D
MGTVDRSAAERQRQAKILRFWRAVEYFSPPKVDPVNPKKHLFAVGANRPLPWEPGSRIDESRPRANRVWRHTVYAGIFSVDKVRNVLLDAFRVPDAEQDFDGRTGGDGAVLCFTVNEQGQLIKDSVTLSSCAWAIGQTLDPGPHDDQWLTGFEAQSTLLSQRLLDLGDGKVDVERCPPPDQESPSAGLGAVAGLMSRIAVSAAKGGVGAAAAAVGGGLGPVAGAVAAKVIEQVGADLLDSAATRLPGRNNGAPSAGEGVDETGELAEGHETETEAEGPPAAVGTKVLDVHDLAAVTRWVAERLGVAAVLRPNAIRVKSYQVSARQAEDSGGDTFLNSFYADDLERVADALEAGQVGTALRDYLREEAELDAAPRCDVRGEPATVLGHVQPAHMPLGRWPADNDKPLVLSQQFAVNRIMDTLGADDGRGVYAVNGPPGTGKTTMLRDLIAALVVRRAERLATLDSPERAFARKPLTWRTEETAGKPFPRTIHPLIPELTGFEMVIASSNNGAVENVTLEVPGARAIGDDWKPYADYLSDPAGLLLGEDAWGAIAARLGRRSNRSDFVERFWWGEPAKKSGRGPARGAGEDSPRGLQEMLRLQRAQSAVAPRGAAAAHSDAPPTAPPLGRETWAQAVERFTGARRRVRELAAERQEIADLRARVSGPDSLLDELLARRSHAHDAVRLLQEEQTRVESAVSRGRDEYARRRAVVASTRTRFDAAEAAVRVGEESVRQAEAALHAHDVAKPGPVRRVLTREPMRRWEAGRAPLASYVAAADARLAVLASDAAALHADLRTAQGQLDEASAAVRRREARLALCEQARVRQLAMASEAGHQVVRRRREREAERQRLAGARERWGNHVPGDEWQAGPDDRSAMERRELSAPWMDAEFAAARSELFLAALNLHRALLATAPDLLRRNLQAVMDVVKGQAPADLPARTVLAAWQMLFLVVPVVSTTFASAGRMFSRLGSEALGWLFVDEAGQAAPQEVVGALWRSRRAVVVGDPLQLEPVVTLPWTGQQRLAGHFSVHRQWAPAAASVQSLADRLNPYGTWLAGEDGERVWLGSPLRVHRRCDRLMFDVSNKIAYDGMMVYGVSRDQDHFPPVRWSIWMDVGSLPGEEKWNPEEGRKLALSLDLISGRIEQATGEGPAAQDAAGGESAQELRRRLNETVFVVSPFREVVNGIGRVAGDRLDPRRYGTVHTAQGKEADIVILVLGTGRSQVNSRGWASQKPNLLNVAVTRARRRLIVIGDFDDWSRHRYFRDLAEHADMRRWTPGG